MAMKILHISPEGTIDVMGGRGVWLRKMLPLIGRNHDVKLLSFDSGVVDNYELIDLHKMISPVSTEYLGMQYVTNFYYLKTLIELFKTWKPDLIHVHDADALDAVLAIKGDIPMVYTCHLSSIGAYLEGLCDAPHMKYLISREQMAMLYADSVHVCSKYYASHFSKDPEKSIWYFGQEPHVIYNGVDTNDFDKAGIALGKKYKNIFYAGRFAVGKGIETLCELIPKMKDCRFIFAGQYSGSKNSEKDYPPCKAINEMAEKYPERVIKLGHVPHHKIGYWAKQCDVWVTPSWHCPFELVGLEAMACGVPLVCTKTGAFLEYGEDGYNCMMAEPKDEDSLDRAIRNAMNNDQLIKNGYETIQKYTWEKSAQQMMELYEHTMATVSLRALGTK